MFNNKYLNTLLLGFLIVLVAVLLYKTCNKPKDGDNIHQLPQPTKTDTVIGDTVPIMVIPSGYIPIRPEKVIIHDTIYRDTTNPNLVLVKQLISQSRLSFTFKDSLGKYLTKQYPVDLRDFDYVWLKDTLAGTPTQTKVSIRSPITTSAWLYLGYNPFSKASYLATEGTIEYKRVGLFTRGQFSTRAPNWDFQIGGKFRLK